MVWKGLSLCWFTIQKFDDASSTNELKFKGRSNKGFKSPSVGTLVEVNGYENF